MTGRWRVGVAVATAVLFAVAVLAIAVNLQSAPTGQQTRLAQVLYLGNPAVTFVLAGYLVAVRPRHPAGWLTEVIALAGVTDSIAKGVANLGIGHAPFDLLRWAAWLDNWTWVLEFGGVALLLLVLPDGRLASRRWRPVTVGVVLATVASVVACAGLGRSVDYPHIPVPLDLGVPFAVGGLVYAVLLVGLLAGAASLLVRRRAFRRAGDRTGTAQLRWIFWATGIVLVVEVVGFAFDFVSQEVSLVADVMDVVSQLAFYGFPVAIAVAVSRHGLFEIDKVVSRTVTYAVVTALLLATYVGIIAGLSASLPTDVNSFVVAAATLAVAALFVPLRRRVQHRVDRRFNRTRHDRDVLVEKFADRLRRNVGSGDDDLLAVVHRALEPAHAGVWLVPR